MRYWLQVRAPAGNWVDSLGSNDRNTCVDHGRWYVKNKIHLRTDVRVVERTDVQVWPEADDLDEGNSVARRNANL